MLSQGRRLQGNCWHAEVTGNFFCETTSSGMYLEPTLASGPKATEASPQAITSARSQVYSGLEIHGRVSSLLFGLRMSTGFGCHHILAEDNASSE